MENQKQAAQGSAATAQASVELQPSLKFDQMTPRQKAVFILKLAVCILSFGFIFPGLTSD